MAQGIHVNILTPSELTEGDWKEWARLSKIGAVVKTPYANPLYIKTIAHTVPNAMIARFSEFHEQGERACGYLAYQIRGNVLQPLGAPLTDYLDLGFVGDCDQVFPPSLIIKALEALLLAAEASHFEGVGLLGIKSHEQELVIGLQSNLISVSAQTRRVAKIGSGYEHWYNAQNSDHHKFFKNIRRCQRNLERDFPDAQYEWRRVDKSLLTWVIERKREQYSRSHYHDIFSCGWTRDLLTALSESSNDELELMAGVISIDNQVIAAEIALSTEDHLHLWYPAYDDAYARYSVGMVLVLEIIKDAASRGVSYVDFGTGSEAYKIPFTTKINDCVRMLLKSPKRKFFDRATDRIAKILSDINSIRLLSWQQKVTDRMMSIRGCETERLGRLKAIICLFERFIEKLIARLRNRQAPPN